MGHEEAKKPAPKRRLIDPIAPLSDTARMRYLSILKDAFDRSKGLRVSRFSDDDRVGKGSHLAEIMPCLFFTEQAAGDSTSHWRRYGRLGFGMTKRAIFNHGGAPVIYTGGTRHQVEQSIDVLRKHFDNLPQSETSKCREAIEFLARMVKVTRMPPSGKTPVGGGKRATASTLERRKTKINPMCYPSERPIRFLMEREWRLVANTRTTKRWRVCAEGHTWFTPSLGTELQLVILPDNKTLHMAIECDEIRKSLISKDRPPVQLLTAEALHKL